MKKLFTLLLALGAVSASFAQSRDSRYESKNEVLGRSDNNRYDHDGRWGNDNDNDRYRSREAERVAQLQRIDREFDARVYAVRTNRWMRTSEKARQVRLIQGQRAEAIRQVNARYSQGRSDNDRYARGNSRY